MKNRMLLILLAVMLALSAGLTGCGGEQAPDTVEYDLTIFSTQGGSVATPGEGTFTYDEGDVVNLVAEAEEGYRFVNWTGDTDALTDVDDSTTTLTMDGDYAVTANFVEGRLIRNWYDLDAIKDNLDGSYILMNDLDATTAGYEELASPRAHGGQGWQPIEVFSGSLDGQGHEIADLFVDRPDNDYVGLFGQLSWLSVIKNVGVVNVTVTGHWTVGGLAGSTQGTVGSCYSIGNVAGDRTVGGLVGNNAGTVSNSYSTANVTGDDFFVGGLVGDNHGTVSNSYSAASVTGRYNIVGGLVGDNHGTVSNSYSIASVSGNVTVGGLTGNNDGTVSNCYSAASVTGNEDVGGLVGYNKAAVRDSHSVASVTGYRWIGGLVGYNYDGGTIIDSCSTASVIGENDVGGLVGGSWGIVSNSYSASNVTGDDHVGGLVGQNYGTVSDCYSRGTVTGTWNVGGLVGRSYQDIVRNSFWDIETSGRAASAGGTGETTLAMKSIATFSGAGWYIIAVALGEKIPAYTWNIVDGETYPFLHWESAS